MVDNLKSAVLQRLAGAAPVFNPRYLDFARHHGFAIEPCNVARGNEKGRVESGVGYVKKNFLHGIELTDFSAIQAAAQVWLDTIANVRIHGETQQRPVDLLAQARPVRQTSAVLNVGAILWFDPRREHSSIPTAKSPGRRAGPVKAGRVCAATRKGLALIGPSTVACRSDRGCKRLPH